MLKLCFKDFLACRWWWLLLVVFYGFSWMFPFRQNLGFMLYTLTLAACGLAITLSQDYMNKTEILYASLPLTRAEIVGGRYLLTGFLGLAAGLYAFALASLLNSVFHFRWTKLDLGALTSPEGLTGFALALILLASLYFPFYYRFGVGRANFAFLLSLLAAALLISGLGRLHILPSSLVLRVRSPEFAKDIGAGIIGLLGQVRRQWGTPLFVAAAGGLASIILAVSIRLSIRFYKKAEI